MLLCGLSFCMHRLLNVHVVLFSVACLAALQRHGECLALVNKRLEEEIENPDLFIMRARLHELFRNVSVSLYYYYYWK